jgi:MFS family permease
MAAGRQGSALSSGASACGRVVKGVSQVFADGALALTRSRTARPDSPNSVLAASAVGSCLVFASGGIVSVVLAAIGREFGLAPFQLQWVVNAELLPLAALTLVAGAAGDRFGQRKMFLLGLVTFALATVGSAVAPTWGTLVGCRFVVGLGEALILPNGMSLLGQAFPSETKARAVGVWSATAAVASAVGPAVAGLLIAQGSWRTALLMPVPVALLALALALLWIRRGASNRAAPIDILGAALSAACLGGLGGGLTRLSNSGEGKILAFAGIAASIVAGAALVIVELRRRDRAMLPLALFSSRSVVGANLYTVLLYGPFTVVGTLIPFVIIRGTSLPPTVAGLAFIPLQALITFLSPLAGHLCRRVGRRAPLFVGSILVAAGCATGLRIGPTATYWHDIFPAVLLIALGLSTALAPLATLVLTSVDSAHAGVASGVNSAISRTGSLLAVALLGGVLQMDGPALFQGLHAALIVSAISCVLATLAALIIEPGAHVDYIPPS